MTHASADLSEDPAPRFSAVLRARTQRVHREAERCGFIADLIRGRAARAGYALFLRNLIPAYDAMERALASAAAVPLLAPFAAPALRRRPRPEADLEAIAGAAWAQAHPVLPEAGAYAAAIEAVAASPPRLAAHAYARYLGDLSGGQILKPILARSLGIGPAALTFYDFPDVADVTAPKTAMRAALDGIDPGDPVADMLVEEALAAFRHNIAVSEAVGAASG